MKKDIEYRPLIACDGPSQYGNICRLPSRSTCATVALILISAVLMYLYSTSLPSLSLIDGEEAGSSYSRRVPVNSALDDDEQHFNYNRSYFVDTAGCRMPSLPILDEHNKKYFTKKIGPLHCTPAMLQSDKDSIWFQLTAKEIKKYYGVKDTKQIKCCYRAFESKTNKDVIDVGKEICFKFGKRVKIKDEFIRVNCSQPPRNRSTFYTDYFAFVPLKEAVEERCEIMRNLFKARFGEKEDKLSVMMLGIDSVSRLNFHRMMPLTAEMIIDRLKGVELFGYNKVGDNTYPNLVPILAGLNTDELDASYHPYHNSSFDYCPFIWKKFSEAGYRTFYTEDDCRMETFTFNKKGFRNQPTDYYLRSFFREADSHITYRGRNNARLCLGGRTPAQALIEYAKKLLVTMKNRPSFSLLWSTAVTHDYINHPPLVDKDYRDLLAYMERESFLNNTAVILLSDHGMRWGYYRFTYQGMMEDRQPFLYFLLPSWFQQKYSTAYRNLRKNRRQLTSPFDLHETLNDLIDLSSVSQSAIKRRSLDLLETVPIPRGISLFLPIPPTRTCGDAGIAPHWCTCHGHTPLAINDSRVMIAAQFAVQSLNHMLKEYPQCSVLYLHSITDAYLGTATKDKKGNQPKNQVVDINVQFVTKPGDAQFEATVRLDSRNRSSLTGGVSRTNSYGQQSRCVDDSRMKLYCFCAG